MNLKSGFTECFVESLTQMADKTAHAQDLTHDSKAWKHSGLLFPQNDHKLTQKGVRSVQMRNIKLNMQT